MREFLPGGARSPLPSVLETQRRASRNLFEVISTGSTLQRESLAAVRTASHIPLNAVERTTGADVSAVLAGVDDGFDATQDASDRAENRFLSAMLSTSRRTADYAELVDESLERVCTLEDAAD